MKKTPQILANRCEIHTKTAPRTPSASVPAKGQDVSGSTASRRPRNLHLPFLSLPLGLFYGEIAYANEVKCPRQGKLVRRVDPKIMCQALSMRT